MLQVESSIPWNIRYFLWWLFVVTLIFNSYILWQGAQYVTIKNEGENVKNRKHKQYLANCHQPMEH